MAAQLMAARAATASAVPDISAELDLATAWAAESMLARDAAAPASGGERPPLVVIGHRGKGMNALASPDERLREVKENSVQRGRARRRVGYVEFDVQGEIPGKRVTDLRLDEFLSYGPHKDQNKVVSQHAEERPVIFSSFQPDAARLMRNLQDQYPVYFLTDGETQLYADPRRNSLEEAVRLCRAGGLQGIVSEARAVFRHPSAVARVKDAGLSLLTYGQLK
ncbi:hypothetical protein ACQ4PT_043788 [Festuca glaucescens]